MAVEAPPLIIFKLKATNYHNRPKTNKGQRLSECYMRRRLNILLEVPLDVMNASVIGVGELIERCRGEVEVVRAAPFATVNDRD